MSYFVEVILNLLISIFCYLTNWFVVLFADERGELHGIWRYLKTCAHSLDVDFYFKEKVWKIFRYDFDSKYISSRETTPELEAVGRDKGCVILKDGATFSIKEKIQRYFCRVGWLMRNNAYGFAFYIFGKSVVGSDVVFIKSINDRKKQITFAYDKTKNIFIRPWILYVTLPISEHITFNAFLGWKIDYNSKDIKPHKAMIA